MPVPRRLPALALAVLLGTGLLAASPARADEPAAATGEPVPAVPAVPDEPVEPVEPAAPDAGTALDRAEAFAAGELTAPGALRWLPGLGRVVAARLPDQGVDGSQVQRDLFRVADDLGADPAARARARALLARPTDGRRDPIGDGYRAPARRTCSTHVCVHFVTRGRDAPPDRAWVQRTLSVMERVWRTEVDRLGYRRPLADGRRGGDARFDVYLKDLGALGAYGYCTPERVAAGRRTGTSAGYCVLDDDFAPEQFGGVGAVRSLKVTAAHEFFHAVQLAYTVGSDAWFAESTAVWMENQVFGGIDDNRQYLPFGQLDGPGRPLDRFQPAGFAQYGNWVFWQRISDRFGTRVVRRVWERTARGPYASRALQQVLAGRRGGLPGVLADVGSALSDAPAAFGEGASWPAPKAPDETVLGATAPRAVLRTRLDHLATRSFLLRPDPATVPSRRARLTVRVRGPKDAGTSPGAHVRIRKTDGRVASRAVRLDGRGRGRTTVPFGAAGVASVTVTVANASTRFVCRRGTLLSCNGRALDDGSRFRVVARLRP